MTVRTGLMLERAFWQASNGTRSTAPLAARYLEAYRYLARAVPASSRLDGVSFTHHQAVYESQSWS